MQTFDFLKYFLKQSLSLLFLIVDKNNKVKHGYTHSNVHKNVLNNYIKAGKLVKDTLIA